jgi:hypothetical protein
VVPLVPGDIVAGHTLVAAGIPENFHAVWGLVIAMTIVSPFVVLWLND